MIIHSDEEFLLECNENFGHKFIHCEVHSWKPSSFRKGLKVFNSLIKSELEKGTDKFISVTPNPKFCELLGGTCKGELEHEGKQYKVYVWELKSLQR